MTCACRGRGVARAVRVPALARWAPACQQLWQSPRQLPLTHRVMRATADPWLPLRPPARLPRGRAPAGHANRRARLGPCKFKQRQAHADVTRRTKATKFFCEHDLCVCACLVVVAWHSRDTLCLEPQEATGQSRAPTRNCGLATTQIELTPAPLRPSVAFCHAWAARTGLSTRAAVPIHALLLHASLRARAPRFRTILLRSHWHAHVAAALVLCRSVYADVR